MSATREALPLTIRACSGCGTEFEGKGRAKWCSDRCRKNALYSYTCQACGKWSPYTGHKDSRFCFECGQAYTAALSAQRHMLTRVQAEAMWADGYTWNEIKEATGLGMNMSTARARGYDLPHRRTPEQVARITRGTMERLAKARAARRVNR